MTGRVDGAIQRKLEEKVRQLESERRTIEESRAQVQVQVQEANETVGNIRHQWKQELLQLSAAEQDAAVSGVLLRVGAKRQMMMGSFRRLILNEGEVYNDVRRRWNSAHLVYACQEALEQLQYLQGVCESMMGCKDGLPLATAPGSSDLAMVPTSVQEVANDLSSLSIAGVLRAQATRDAQVDHARHDRPHAVPQEAGRGFTVVQDEVPSAPADVVDEHKAAIDTAILGVDQCWVCSKGATAARGALFRCCPCESRRVHSGCLDEWRVIMAGTQHAAACTTCGEDWTGPY